MNYLSWTDQRLLSKPLECKWKKDVNETKRVLSLPPIQAKRKREKEENSYPRIRIYTMTGTFCFTHSFIVRCEPHTLPYLNPFSMNSELCSCPPSISLVVLSIPKKKGRQKKNKQKRGRYNATWLCKFPFDRRVEYGQKMNVMLEKSGKIPACMEDVYYILIHVHRTHEHTAAHTRERTEK